MSVFTGAAVAICTPFLANGDVDYDKVSEIAEAVTPVPGGVGSITTAILLKHVVVNAERQA